MIQESATAGRVGHLERFVELVQAEQQYHLRRVYIRLPRRVRRPQFTRGVVPANAFDRRDCSASGNERGIEVSELRVRARLSDRAIASGPLPIKPSDPVRADRAQHTTPVARFGRDLRLGDRNIPAGDRGL